MRVLMIGDVIGRPGRRAVRIIVPELRSVLQIDLVIANGENSAGGAGLTSKTAQELFSSGVDVITAGNHIWDQKEIIPHLETEAPILRPSNYPPAAPGHGHVDMGNTLVINLIGRVFMGTFDCPFRAADSLLESEGGLPKAVIVDMHAEATSEKAALAWHLDGRVSAVLGTHTHVATADTRILPGGTAFVSDVGMAGPVNSIIGVEPAEVLERFLTQMPKRLKVAKKGPTRFNSVMVDIDDSSGKATAIERVDREIEGNDA